MKFRSVKARLQLAVIFAECKHGVTAFDRRFRDAIDHFPENPGQVAVYRDSMLPRVPPETRRMLVDAIALAMT